MINIVLEVLFNLFGNLKTFGFKNRLIDYFLIFNYVAID